MKRLIPEQRKCENCGFTNLIKYPAIFNGNRYPEYLRRILDGYIIECKNCGAKYPLDREIIILTENGELVIHTKNEKKEIEKKFQQYGLTYQSNEK